MVFEFQKGETLENGARRIARELIDGALRTIANSESDPESAIHEVRKYCKKLRALVRLFRDEFGRSEYRAENRRFRDIAREFSERRDRVALVEAIKDVLEAKKEDNIQQLMEALRLSVCSHFVGTLPSGRPEGFDRAEELFREARDRCSSWKVGGNDFSVVKPSIKRAYRRGRETFAEARKNPDLETMHEWRKSSKYLWYHYRLLNRLRPSEMSPAAERQHDLCSRLGHERDVRILSMHLEESPKLVSDRAERKMLLKYLSRRRKELLKAIWDLGDELYAEKPKIFVSRLGCYWKSEA